MRSNHYSSSDPADEVAEEFVTAPGHGAVGVFQSPQPVRPRGGPVDTTLDIDSPFLDLFGGAAPPTPVSSAPTSSTPAGESSAKPPAEDPDLDFDFGFDFDDRPTVANGSTPSTPDLAPPDPRPVPPSPAPSPSVSSPSVSSPPVSSPSVSSPPVSSPPVAESPLGPPSVGRSVSGPPFAGPPVAGPSVSGPPAPRDPGSELADGQDGPWGTSESIEPFSRAPIGPKADFFQESGAPADPSLDEWPDFDHWPTTPQAGAGSAPPARPVSTPPLWQTVGGSQARAPQPGPIEAYAPQPLVEDAPAEGALPIPVPEKAPAKRKEKAPARRRKEPKNLPVKQDKSKPVALRPHKLKFNDRDPVMELEISEIAGHLTFTQSTVTAWYYLPEVRWAFRPDAEREALLSAISEQYAGLAGFRLHLRRTNRPFPADEWARTVDSFTAKPLPDVRGGTSWSDHLVAAQRHLLSVNHAEGQTYLGVTFARRSLGDTFSERVLRIFGRGTSDGERRKLNRAVEQFDEVLNAFGMRGRRVTPQELEWLLFRSVALCMAPPGPLSPVTNGQWDTGDLLALTEQVERYRTPYGSTVKLVNRMTGEERHVAVLSVGRMEPLEIPEKHEPWMHFHERLPWPMELSSRIDILGSNSSFKNLEHRLRMIRSQQLDYAEHGIDAPPELERLAKRALVIGDEMTTGLPVESARAHGWHRIAVGGATREECLERARRLIQLYSRELRISLQHPKNQDQLAREFIPGEPIANTGYVRRMPVKLLAAALPQAASTVGDRRGDLIGRTAGTCRRPVFLDLHFPMEVRERSGLGVFVAEPGGGKSTLMGALGYLNARRGVQVTLLDPSGPLARLCQMPELRPYSRVLNLTGSEQGTLAPYALIPTPVRSEFATGPGGDREYEIAVSNARAERRMLVQDICSMLVPPQVAKEASTATLLRHAVRQVPAEESSTLDDVVRTLQGLDDDEGRELANLLLDTAEMPLALLFFGSPPQHLLGADAALTVITMAGLRLPDLKIEREYWSAEESLALPMLHTAHRLAVRRCYGGSMSSRKMVGLDEAHFMEGWRSGRSFLVRLARDSRKWNLAALVASQNPRDILGLDVQNLVSTVFVGRIAEDQEIASEALRLLRVPVHDGYEATLASLSQVDTSSSSRLGFREFVMRDVDGRVQKVRVDVSYVEGLLEHLDTTPTGAKAAPAIPMSPSDLEV
ncbi:ATP-binding protein [Paractinoplanes brasiliensis]|uniref:ATP-binding protein n=1 Tax=Paractinoplanes brasiliensis TaxID=52695 RepID=UPI001EF1E5E4|nr:ATP-binding protein [Actinoplanes brasiliensis]